MAQVPTFQTLPTEVALLAIAPLTIPELVRVSHVDKRAYRLVQLLFERNSQKFRSYLMENLPLTDARLLTALTRFPHAIDIHIDTPLTSIALQSVAQLRPQLRSFHLHSLKGDTFGNFTEMELVTFLGNKRRIQKLTLQGCPTLTDTGLTQVVEAHPGLVALTVDSPFLSDGVVQKVLECLRRLSRLDLSGSNEISDATLKMLATRPHAIRQLELKIYRFPFSKEAVKDALAKLKNLESFALHGCQKMNDAMVELLAKNNPNLRHLYLFGCYLTKNSIKHLYKYVPQIESLHLNDCEKPAPLKLELSKKKFGKLTSEKIIGFSFWDCLYPAYLKQVEIHGTPHDFERQIAYMYYLQAKTIR